jgi:TonB family protein
MEVLMTQWRWRGVGLAVAVGLALAAAAVGDERQAAFQEREQKAKAAKAAELGFVLDPEVAPKAEHIARAHYPKELLAQRRAGTVLVLFGISPKGAVVAPEVLESSPGFDAAALKSIAKWRFRPAKKAGIDVGTVEVVPVIFKVY